METTRATRADLLQALNEVADEGRFADDALIEVDLDMPLRSVKPSELMDWLVERFEIRHREPAAVSTHAEPSYSTSHH